MKTTTTKYTKEQVSDVIRLLKAMAHPERLAIVKLIEQQKILTVTEIYVRLKIEQPIASHHLTILKTAGVLNGKKDGKTTNYTLSSAKVASLLTAVYKLISV